MSEDQPPTDSGKENAYYLGIEDGCEQGSWIYLEWSS